MTMDFCSLAKTLSVDAGTGKVFWSDMSWRNGKEAGYAKKSVSTCGKEKHYWTVCKGGKHYPRSKIIYASVTGVEPPEILDHIDGDSLNDTFANLRAATIQQNSWNRKRITKRSGLPMGVAFNKSCGKFQSQIMHCGKSKYLGVYSTPEEASAVYQQKRKELFGEYA